MRMDEGILHPPIDEPDIEWCDEHQQDIRQCVCADGDPDAAYENLRDDMMEASER